MNHARTILIATALLVTPRLLLAVVVIGTGVSLPFGRGGYAAAGPTKHTVVIQGERYEPETLTVERGDSVVWVNKDPFPHTVTASKSFDSHSIAAGASWKYVARKTGRYSYHCIFHPYMKGLLKVE